MAKQPSMQFYPGDWMKDPAVRACSYAAKGLWVDMLCLMWESPQRGFLRTQTGIPMDLQKISNAAGGARSEVAKLLKELENNGVYSVSEDGCIYCRRMVRDEEQRKRLVESGKSGGNPNLGVNYNLPGFVYFAQRSRDGAIKIGISANPSKRIYQLRAKEKQGSVELLGQKWVEDMGAEEKKLHDRFRSQGSGEWFQLTREQQAELIGSTIPLDIPLKQKRGSSTSSSSSTSVASSSEPDFSGFANACRELYPDTSDGLIRVIVEECVRVCSEITDEEMICVMRAAIKPKQWSAALFKNTMPEVVRSWASKSQQNSAA